MVSARRGNGSRCEDCKASPQRDVLSSRDLTNGLQDRSISTHATSSSGDISRAKVYEKKPRTTMDLKQNSRDELAAISPTMLSDAELLETLSGMS